MKVGILQIFQNYEGQGDDADVVDGELRLGVLAEEVGFDKVWAVEHHFTDYAACPDNFTYLACLAGRTERVRLGTGAVIVPWNDPLRVAEKVSLLDHLSGGRLDVGFGRGLSRIEYRQFGIDMGESRQRFDEAARMIIEGLEKGFVEGAGEYYAQPRAEIRPRPRGGIRDRLYCVGMSPESVEQAAALGARLMVFTQQMWQTFADGDLKSWRASYRQHQGTEPPPPLTGDLMYCHADAAVAEDKGLEYMTNYFLTIVKHYEIMSDHFKDVKGYDYYATSGELFAQVGIEVAAQTYVQVQTFGTPEQILEKLRWRRELMGDFELNMVSYYGGMGVDVAEKSLKLFSKEVLPELKGW